ncbi:uncharacterized protein [Diabrotica undecimpunctata]|uniref:uncharacterized protein n=1 Tax=Diabrotica undecimpunctata TaxID=50387 RepID=UPI003B63A133
MDEMPSALHKVLDELSLQDKTVKPKRYQTSTKKCIRYLKDIKKVEEETDDSEKEQSESMKTESVKSDIESKMAAGNQPEKFKCMSDNCDFVCSDRGELIRHLYQH